MYWPGSAIVHTPLNTKAKQTQPNLYQLTREWPPGYGGMERVAHELATAWQQWGKKVSTISLRGRLRAHDADPCQ